MATTTRRREAKEIGYTNFSAAQVRRLAQPARGDNGEYVWWASGGGGWGADPEAGVIPFEIAAKLPPATVANPIGSGGRRFRTYGESMRALRSAIDGTPFDANYDDIGHGI